MGKHWGSFWGSAFYCGCPEGIDQKWEYWETWAKRNFFSRYQVRSLLRKRYLFGLKYRNRMHVMENPDQPIPEEYLARVVKRLPKHL